MTAFCCQITLVNSISSLSKITLCMTPGKDWSLTSLSKGENVLSPSIPGLHPQYLFCSLMLNCTGVGKACIPTLFSHTDVKSQLYVGKSIIGHCHRGGGSELAVSFCSKKVNTGIFRTMMKWYKVTHCPCHIFCASLHWPGRITLFSKVLIWSLRIFLRCTESFVGFFLTGQIECWQFISCSHSEMLFYRALGYCLSLVQQSLPPSKTPQHC